jgi:nitrite reductase/ring-hydroxylating ferredoxin subunit
MSELEVARLDQLEEGVPRAVEAFGREIALVLWQDECFAVRNICPHQTVAFTEGIAQGKVLPGAEIGEIVVDRDDPVLRCPRHAWKFALRTGRCTIDPRLRIKAYPVTVREGRVYLSDERP